MTKLSVNINKVATLRNARGGNNPDVVKVALDCEAFGAEGITVHPRPDERHIRRSDVYELRPLLTTEFNIEGYPSPEFVDLVLKVKPHQVTLVPDAPDQITSNAGWDTKTNLSFLTELMDTFGQAGIRTSIFVGTDKEMIEYAAKAGADRVELYTEPYATMYPRKPEAAIAPFIEAAKVTRSLGMGLNAGHDLSLVNLKYMHTHIPWLDEVSIGHALISDALYMGLKQTIEEYKKKERPKVVLTWAPHPRALPQAVPNSFADFMNEADVDFVITHPEGYELDPKFVRGAHVEYDQMKAFEGADFIYAKNWACPGVTNPADYGKILSKDMSWTVDTAHMAVTNNAYFMHCLPVRRNMIVTDDVIEAPTSLVIPEAANREISATVVLKRMLQSLK